MPAASRISTGASRKHAEKARDRSNHGLHRASVIRRESRQLRSKLRSGRDIDPGFRKSLFSARGYRVTVPSATFPPEIERCPHTQASARSRLRGDWIPTRVIRGEPKSSLPQLAPVNSNLRVYRAAEPFARQ